MTQYARPDSNISVGNWQPSSGPDCYAMIDESSTDDNDYISVTSYGSYETIVVGLSDVDTPDSGTRTVVVRARKEAGMGGGGIDLTVTLKEGGTSKGSQTTSLSTSYTNISFNITSSISDYSDLRLEIVAFSPCPSS